MSDQTAQKARMKYCFLKQSTNCKLQIHQISTQIMKHQYKKEGECQVESKNALNLSLSSSNKFMSQAHRHKLGQIHL